MSCNFHRTWSFLSQLKSLWLRTVADFVWYSPKNRSFFCLAANLWVTKLDCLFVSRMSFRYCLINTSTFAVFPIVEWSGPLIHFTGLMKQDWSTALSLHRMMRLLDWRVRLSSLRCKELWELRRYPKVEGLATDGSLSCMAEFSLHFSMTQTFVLKNEISYDFWTKFGNSGHSVRSAARDLYWMRFLK